MKTETKKYRDQTNALLEEMSPVNKEYFDKLYGYVLLATFLKDEASIREQIYNMAVDLRDAEQDGMTAEEFFGKDARGMADAIIANTPKIHWRELTSLMLLIGSVLGYYRLLQDFSSASRLPLNVLPYLSDFVLGSLAVYLIFQCLSRMIYSRRTWVWSGLIGLIAVVTFFLMKSAKEWLSAGWGLVLPSPWDMVLVFAVSLIYLGWSLRDRTFWCFIFPIIAFLLVGILRRWLDGVQPGNDWLHSWLPIGIIVLGFTLFYWQLFRESKQLKQK